MHEGEPGKRFRVRDNSLFRISLPFWLTLAIFTLIEVPVSLLGGRTYKWSGFEGWFYTLLAISVGSTLLNLLIKVVFESSFVITDGAIIHESRVFHSKISREGLKVKVDGGLRGLITFYRNGPRLTLPDLVDLNSAGLRRFIFLESLYRSGIPVEGPGFTKKKAPVKESSLVYERLIGWVLIITGFPLAIERMGMAPYLTVIGAAMIALGLILLSGSRKSHGLVDNLQQQSTSGMPGFQIEDAENVQTGNKLIIQTEPSLLWGSRIRLVLQGRYARRSPLTHFRPFITPNMLSLIAEARELQMPFVIDSHQGLQLESSEPSTEMQNDLNIIRPDFIQETQAVVEAEEADLKA